MTKILALAVLGFVLSGCAVATATGAVAGAGISVASSVVRTSADVAGSVVGGNSDEKPKR